ncbi:MAG: helix-turn-helix transcriptional regulator [Enterobacterales bacterium endosymbiont of Blomia tropicalis]|uniref:helix-turn-helix domain-containing protein n=1 Tax=Mixta mediterraneensis TaxID=2758443 RepID=UPI0025A7C061|nr:helix-turn-helix transcriptional regulator [Mixta mediterraneensis]MDL4912673.1 helix-turn-helix transcriptional regulator [Mixta mediterraneensis]
MESNHFLSDWHREDILAAVRKKKKSLAALSREHGLSSGTLSNALIRPWPRGEEIIASAIGLPPEEIWPSRYRSKRYRARKRNTISPDIFAV